MRIRNRYKWSEHNITIAAYIPVEVYNRLVEEAKDRAVLSGQYCSLSQLVRDILENHVVMEAEGGRA